jgi:hypothetical protein
LAGNDDEAVGVLSSRVTYYATYTGWLYLLVGPNVEVNYNVSDQYEYKLNCFSSFAPPPPAPQPTSSSSSSSTQAQTAPMPSTTPPATSGVATVMPLSQQIVSVDEVAPQITITSLETASTPVAPAIGSFTVAIHQGSADATDNSSAIEGVGNMPVALYSAGGDLLAFGYTNNQGDLTVDIVSAGSEVTVVIPYLGLREVVSYPAFTFLEITLPSLEINAEDSQ